MALRRPQQRGELPEHVGTDRLALERSGERRAARRSWRRRRRNGSTRRRRAARRNRPAPATAVEPRLRLGPEQGLLDFRLGRVGFGRMAAALGQLDRHGGGHRRGGPGGHSGAVDAPLPMFEAEGLESIGTGGQSGIVDQRNICGPQFLQKKAAGIAGRVGQVARTRSEVRNRLMAVTAMAWFGPIDIFASRNRPRAGASSRH